MYVTTRILHVSMLFLCRFCISVSAVVVNVLVANTHRNVYFVLVSALRGVFVLFQTLLVATVL